MGESHVIFVLCNTNLSMHWTYSNGFLKDVGSEGRNTWTLIIGIVPCVNLQLHIVLWDTLIQEVAYDLKRERNEPLASIHAAFHECFLPVEWSTAININGSVLGWNFILARRNTTSCTATGDEDQPRPAVPPGLSEISRPKEFSQCSSEREITCPSKLIAFYWCFACSSNPLVCHGNAYFVTRCS